MSFPSAASRLEAGDSAEEALLHAMKHDTAMGFNALSAMAAAYADGVDDPVDFVRERLPSKAQAHVLRSEELPTGALKVDFSPDSPVGQQVARLLGTAAARPLVEAELGVHFGFANCCGGIVGKKKTDVSFSPADQIRWQMAPDC